jgi:HK97 family phage prohead protease
MGSVVDAVSILRAGLPELTVPAKQPAAALTAARRPGLIAPGAAADMWLATRSNIKPHAGLAVIAERLRLEETAMVARYGALVEARLMEFAGARASAVSKSLSSRRIDMLIVPYDGSQARLGSFSEVYERGCFAKGLDQDPRALVAHDDTLVLGRKSAGTARFFEDAAGVHVECDAPETTWADDLLVSMRRGDITQASAAFWILQQRWEVRNGEKVRVVEKALLRDGSVVSFAAYSTTTASALSASAARTELDAAQRRLDLMRPSFTDLERAEITLDQLRFAGLTELEIAQARLDRMVRGRPHTELERDQLKLDMLRRGGRPR